MTQKRNGLLTLLRDRYQSVVNQVETQVEAPSVDLPQPARCARRTTWVMLGGLAIGLIWSVVARIDVVVAARGKLEPLSSSQAVQSRIGGVVTAILVQEGQPVERGQLLMQLDKTESLNKLEALSRQREPLVKRVAVLRAIRQGTPISSLKSAGMSVPPELLNQIQNRKLLIAQLTGNPDGLMPDQLQRYSLFIQEMGDKRMVNQFQVNSLQVQSSGADSQVAETEARLRAERTQLARLEPLVKAGALSQVDFMQRVVQVNALQNQLNQNRVQHRQLQFNRMQAQVDGRRTVGDMYRETQAELAKLDTEIENTIERSQQQLIQLNAQLSQVKMDIRAQDLKSPVDGIVFDLQPKLPGLVTQSGQVLMQVTPNESLIARIQVANSDITNLRVGIPVDVRIDAYPFTEFGAISGIVTKVGSDAISASKENTTGQTFFPVEVRLEHPFLSQQSQRHPLVPGMTITANIKVQSRAPISLVADQIIRVFDGARSIR